MKRTRHLGLALLFGTILVAHAAETVPATQSAFIDLLKASVPNILHGFGWLAENVTKAVLAFTGAVITYLFMGLPEAAVVKRRLRAAFPNLDNLDRVVAIVLIVIGTVIALVTLQPGSYPGALYAGMSWPAVIVNIRNYLKAARNDK